MNLQDCKEMLKLWCDTALKYQIHEINDEKLLGGILCPACNRIHGRCADIMYPLLYLEQEYPNVGYLEAAIKIYQWEEQNVSMLDGSYINDKDKIWKGITVFSIIRWANIFYYHNEIVPYEYRIVWKKRLQNALDFLCESIDDLGGNVNYTITSSEALAWGWKIFNDEKYYKKAKELAHVSKTYVNQDNLLFGEGKPRRKITHKGCQAIDIAYNLEESLPSLFACAELLKDDVLKDFVLELYDTHTLFYLEDGALDNSIGTRNYKWTYWGSRTSCGSAAILYKIAKEKNNRMFETIVIRNLNLMKKATVNGFLTAGNGTNKETPCIHLNFSHANMITHLLEDFKEIHDYGRLPFYTMKESKYFSSLDTTIITKNNWRATISGYDFEYVRGGHISGHALALLAHKEYGTIFCSSMSEYQLVEPNNMNAIKNMSNICLSPRLERTVNGDVFSQVYDYTSTMTQHQNIFTSIFTLKNKQLHEDSKATISYCFDSNMYIEVTSEKDSIFVFPVILSGDEEIYNKNGIVYIQKEIATLCISTQNIYLKNTIYHPSPGLNAKYLYVNVNAKETKKIVFSVERSD